MCVFFFMLKLHITFGAMMNSWWAKDDSPLDVMG